MILIFKHGDGEIHVGFSSYAKKFLRSVIITHSNGLSWDNP